MKKVTEETAIKGQIKDYLKWMGWFVFPILQGLGAYKGIADLIACKGGDVIFIEVKTPRGEKSDDQKKFESDLRSHGCHYTVARSWEDIKAYILAHDLGR